MLSQFPMWLISTQHSLQIQTCDTLMLKIQNTRAFPVVQMVTLLSPYSSYKTKLMNLWTGALTMVVLVVIQLLALCTSRTSNLKSKLEMQPIHITRPLPENL